MRGPTPDCSVYAQNFYGQSRSEVYCLSLRELADVNLKFVINCEVYRVGYVLNLPDCQTVQLGLKLKETQDLGELISLGFDVNLLVWDTWYKVMMEG